ncbi:MAG: hypothetical protein EXS47_02115 [Candidatus Zambryskibacteria bacterium]|nr:hypothetical protein [Candidatus Zambryskibacteria bacterium]
MVERILELNKEKTTFWSLLAVLFLCLGFYMYFINATVHNVVSRQDLEAEASALTLTIGNQEFEYITKRNGVTLALAYSLGFKDSDAKTFISKKSSSQVSVLLKSR